MFIRSITVQTDICYRIYNWQLFQSNNLLFSHYCWLTNAFPQLTVIRFLEIYSWTKHTLSPMRLVFVAKSCPTIVWYEIQFTLTRMVCHLMLSPMKYWNTIYSYTHVFNIYALQLLAWFVIFVAKVNPLKAFAITTLTPCSIGT
jgi:hypothetical protein